MVRATNRLGNARRETEKGSGREREGPTDRQTPQGLTGICVQSKDGKGWGRTYAGNGGIFRHAVRGSTGWEIPG